MEIALDRIASHRIGLDWIGSSVMNGARNALFTLRPRSMCRLLCLISLSSRVSLRFGDTNSISIRISRFAVRIGRTANVVRRCAFN